MENGINVVILGVEWEFGVGIWIGARVYKMVNFLVSGKLLVEWSEVG